VALFNDITSDVVDSLGFGITTTTGGGSTGPVSMRWDCAIGGLPFLLAPSQQNPLHRETSDFRRQRVDNSADPGEQSLDSGFWTRSQASWHYGAGLPTAEPLETNATEAKFRYKNSGGVDPWTPGQLSLLRDTEKVASTQLGPMIGVELGVLWASTTAAQVNYTTRNGATTTAITWGGSVSSPNSMTFDGANAYLANATGIYKMPTGTLPSGTGTLYYNGAFSVVRYVKSRLMATNGSGAIYELTGAGAPTAPSPLFTHPVSGWAWTDFAEGPSAIYVAGYAADQSQIYKIGVTSSASTVTLSQPVVVADMPRGEKVVSLYSYVGSYLIIGTSKGVRVASMNASDGSLSLGPILFSGIDDATGSYDAVADGQFVYVSASSKGEVGDQTKRAGLYRIDMSTTVDGNPLRFAYAPDVVATTGTDPLAKALWVTQCKTDLWFTDDFNGLYRRSTTAYVPAGWVETGRIRMGTVEPKAWRDIRVIEATTGAGTVTAYASTTGSGAPSTWTQVVQTSDTDADKYGLLNVAASGRQQSLYVAFKLAGTTTASTPLFTGYQVRAIPAPKRTELVSVPVMLYDRETDRMGNQYGKDGGAWDRYVLLKSLEASASTVTWKDYTTGEQAEAYVERVTWIRSTAPTRGRVSVGGTAQILLRLV